MEIEILEKDLNILSIYAIQNGDVLFFVKNKYLSYGQCYKIPNGAKILENPHIKFGNFTQYDCQKSPNLGNFPHIWPG